MDESFLNGWPDGVIGATDATLLGGTASPRGLNSVLGLSLGGKPYAAKRDGLSCINRTQISGATPIIGQYDYYKASSGVRYHALVSRGGRLDTRATDDTITSRSTALTSGDYYPDFAVAADLLFIVNGQDRLKFNGSTVTNFGITRPTVGTLAGAAGGAGLHSGTYELRVTFANSSTGHESSASDTASATVTVTNQEISWSNIPVSADAQVDTRYLYARNTATQTQFFRVGTIANNTATTATTSILDANATTAAPSTTGRNRPPSGAKYLAFHQGRMFVATDTALCWSRPDEPEAFDDLATDGVNSSDGQRITGLVSTKEILLILKEDRVYGIFNGNNPLSWQIRLIDDDYGCTSHRTIVTMDGVTYWWSRHGLCGWAGGDEVINFTDRYYGPIETDFSSTEWARASAAKDETNNRLLIALAGTGSTRANRIIPFNTGLQRFEATYWDPLDAASLGTAIDSDGRPSVFLGGYAGQLFQFDSRGNDGVAAGTVEGTWVATAVEPTTLSTLLDEDGASAALDTTGGALTERYIELLDSRAVSQGRRRITSNTATAATVATAFTGLQIGATYTWRIGGPDFQWDTPWVGDWTRRKRYEFLYVLTKGSGFGAAMTVVLNYGWAPENSEGQRFFTTTANSATWDQSMWDSAHWDGAAAYRNPFRVARTGYVWQARFKNSRPNAAVALIGLVMQSVPQSRKR